ncbi:hypothetical protein SNE40_019271 [Patella caerulea]|uniref:Uncharacterized protein n=1 Tax=Patella caerulea TaxID=87958 RepID=A0AAN8J6S0_PATCE
MPVVIVTLVFVVLLGMWISLLIYKKKIRRRRDVNRRVGEGANFLTHRTQVEDETDDDTFARPTIEETGESFVKSTVGESSVRGPGKSSVRGSGKETACVSGSVNINPEMSHGPSTTISIGLSDLPPFIGHPSDTGT